MNNTAITPKITTYRFWHPEKVREICIAENWYTRGTTSQYDAMFKMVRDNDPTPEAIWAVAFDIFNHSDKAFWFDGGCTEDEAVESIMWKLENEAVNTSYAINY